MEEKALTVRRRDSWDKRWWDRVSPELGCHQPIPSHDHRGERIHSLGRVPLFLRTTGYKAKLWPSGSLAASAGGTAGEKGGRTAERTEMRNCRGEKCVAGQEYLRPGFLQATALTLLQRGRGTRGSSRHLRGAESPHRGRVPSHTPFTWRCSGTGLRLVADHRVWKNLAKISCDRQVMKTIYKALCWLLSSSEALTFL